MAHEGRAEEVEAGPPEWLQVKSCKGDSNSGGDSNSQKYNKEKPVRKHRQTHRQNDVAFFDRVRQSWKGLLIREPLRYKNGNDAGRKVVLLSY